MSSTKIMFPAWSSDKEILITGQHKHIVSFHNEIPFELRFFQFWHDHEILPNIHDYLELSLIYKGSGVLFVENNKYDLNEGDMIIMGSESFHRFEASSDQPSKVICLFFLPEIIYSFGSNLVDYKYISIFYNQYFDNSFRVSAKDFDYEEVLRLIYGIYVELKEKDQYYALAVKNRLTEILLVLCRSMGKTKQPRNAPVRKSRELIRINKVISFIADNYQNQITLDEVAEMVHVSPSYFCKIFKRFTGCSLKEYVFRKRIDQAKKILLTADMTITEAAYTVGFESHSYFDRVFRRFVNMSPREFKDINR